MLTTDNFKGHWQNDEKQDVEILNYDRKWNYLHKFGNHVKHAHNAHEEDNMKQTKTTWSKQRRHDDKQDMFILKGNYNCGEVNV